MLSSSAAPVSLTVEELEEEQQKVRWSLLITVVETPNPNPLQSSASLFVNIKGFNTLMPKMDAGGDVMSSVSSVLNEKKTQLSYSCSSDLYFVCVAQC